MTYYAAVLKGQVTAIVDPCDGM